MNKKRYAASIATVKSTVVAASLLSLTVLSLTALSGCQSLTAQQPSNKADTVAWVGKITPIAGEVNIACSGTYHCEIAQIDQIRVIAPDTHKPVHAKQMVISTDMNPLLTKKSVKVVPLSASGMEGLTNYYARVKPAKREVHLNFYPENNVSYVERFAMIHEFTQAGTYQLQAYRQKSPKSTGSLLDTASPEPLCIDLVQNGQVLRHFCKQIDAEHQGEFVESRVINRTVVKSKN